MATDKTILDLLDKSSDELFFLLGQNLGGNYIIPPSSKDLIRYGKDWLHQNYLEIKQSICANERIRKLISDKDRKGKKIELIAAIADVISGITIGIPPFVVSVLIFNEGIYSLCA